MLLDEIFQVALQAIRANKLRSFLTMLGIIIGVGAVITMVALGSGAQKSVQARLQALGPTLLSIYPGQSFRGGIAIDFGSRVSVTVDDADSLAAYARYVKAVVPELTRNMQIKRAGQNANVNIVGTTPNYPTVKNYTLLAGRMFTAGENEGRRRVAVLGSAIPDMFNANPAAMSGRRSRSGAFPSRSSGSSRRRAPPEASAIRTSRCSSRCRRRATGSWALTGSGPSPWMPPACRKCR